MMTYKELYDLHIQLLHIYENSEEHQGGSYQNQINYFKRQFFFTEDIVQPIFVLNQLINIHEKRREQITKCCSEEYFQRGIVQITVFSSLK